MHTEQTEATYCASCSQPLSGEYCSHCGEKVLHEHDKSVAHFFHEFFHVLTHWDGKIIKSLKFLFAKPGFLTQEYLAGRRKAYTAPLTLFLIANVIYLLFAQIDALNSHYITQVEGQPYSKSIVGVANKKMKERKWTEAQMEEHYDAKSSKISKMMMLLLVFLFSAPVTLVFYNRQRYYFDHLVFSTEFICFIIYGVLLLLPMLLIALAYVYAYLFKQNVSFSLTNNYAMLAGFLLLWGFLCAAAKRVYKQSWAYTIPKTLLLTVAFVCVMFFYRYLLFYTTMAIL